MRAKGQVLAEFAIALPLLLLAAFGIMQLSLVLVAKMLVNHAAFTAARAELVGEDPEEAAEIQCAPLSGVSGDAGLPGYLVPGRGVLARSGLAREKTSVNVVRPGTLGATSVQVEVTHDYELVFPIVSELFRTAGADYGAQPHRRMTETCTLARRWE